MTTSPAPAPATRAVRQTLTTNVLIALINASTGILAARLLGPAGEGNLAAIQLWPTLLAVIAMAGMSEALAYYAAKDREMVSTYLATSITVALVSSVIVGGISYAILPMILSHYSASTVAAAQRYLLLLPIFALVLLPSHALRGASSWGWWNVLRVAPAALWLGVLLVSVPFHDSTPGHLADANLAVLALLGVAVALVIRRHFQGPYRIRSSSARRLVGYGLPAVGAVVPQLLNLRLDQLLMAALLPPRSLGLYVVAVSWSSLANPPLLAIGMILLPHVAGAHTDDHSVAVLLHALQAAVWTGLGVVALLLALTPIGFHVAFAGAFNGAIPAALVLVVASGFFGLNYVLGEGVRGLGKPSVALYAELAGLAVTAAVLALTLGPLGIMGAALSSLIGYAAVTVGYLLFLRGRIPNLWRSLLRWSGVVELLTLSLQMLRRSRSV